MTEWLFKCALVALLCVTTPAFATPIDYTFSQIIIGTESLNGSIRIDDIDSNEVVDESEILSWAFVAQGLVVSFNLNSGPGAAVDCPAAGCFKIAGSALQFDFRSSSALSFEDSLGARVRFAPDNGLGGDAVPGDQLGSINWNKSGVNGSPNASFSLLRNPVLVVGSSNPVPEPSSALLFGLALGAVVGTAKRRRGARAGLSCI